MKKSDVFLILIIIILIITFIFIKIFTFKSEPILIQYAKRKSNNTISQIVNKSIKEIIYNYDFKNLMSIEKNNNKEITNINFNNNQINYILYLVTENILNTLNNLEKNESLIYYVPIGIIYSSPILVNLGPKIPFKINILGNVNMDNKINVREYGINSFIVEIILIYKLQVQIILPFVSKTMDVEKNIILDSKIIQGNIPNSYGDFNYLLKNK